MADPAKQIGRLRTQRNIAAVGAVLVVALSMAVVLPGFLERHHRLKRAQDELEQLQVGILKTQQATRRVQAEILQVQNEIRALTQPAR